MAGRRDANQYIGGSPQDSQPSSQGGYAPIYPTPLPLPRQANVTNRSPLVTVQEGSEGGHEAADLARGTSFGSWVTVNDGKKSTSDNRMSIDGPDYMAGNSAPIGVASRSDPATSASQPAIPFNSAAESLGPPAAESSRFGASGGLPRTGSVASKASTATYKTARGSDLLNWCHVFEPADIALTEAEMGQYDTWLVAGDILAFSSTTSDMVLLYDCKEKAMTTLPLPCDQWHLSPDGRYILYSQGRLLNLYSLVDGGIIKSELLNAEWATTCQTSRGFVIATISNEGWLWPIDEEKPRQLRSQQAHPGLKSQWTKCNGSIEGQWACVFGHSPGNRHAFIKVYNTQTNEVILVKGIGGQVATLLVKDAKREVLASLDLHDTDKTKLKMSLRVLGYADDTPQELYSPPITIDLPQECQQRGLACQLLVDEALSCIIVLLAASDGAFTTGKIYDALTGSLVCDRDETLLGQLSEMRTDSRGQMVKRSPKGIIEKLSIDRSRFFARRMEAAGGMV